MAIGGESTGVQLVTDSGRLELSADGAIAARLGELTGQQVTLRGRLDERPGVEIRTRRIVTVTVILRPSPLIERRAGYLVYMALARPEPDPGVRAKIARLPVEVRDELNRRLARGRTHESRLPARPTGGDALAVSAQKRRGLEVALVGFAGPAAAAEAAAYASTATLYYEWEGSPDGPLPEAEFAAAYIAKHPTTVLRPYLELFQLHRLRAGFEAGGRSVAFDTTRTNVNAAAQREAAEKYQALWQRVSQSPDPLVKALAVDIDDELFVYEDIADHPRGAARSRAGAL